MGLVFIGSDSENEDDDNYFYHTLPKEIAKQADMLFRYMNVKAMTFYAPQYWKDLSWNSKAIVFLSCQNAKLQKTYEKNMKIEDLESFTEALLNNLDSKLSKKICGALAQFMIDYGMFINKKSLKAIYEKISSQKAGKDAIELIDSNTALKQRIESSSNSKEDGTLYDRIFDNIGLDCNGERTYDLGTKKVCAVLQPDFSFLVVDSSTDKTSKSIPKRGADLRLYKIADEDFKAVQKATKELVTFCRNSLYKLYLSAEEMNAESWKENWTGNPITKNLASTVVWQQGKSFFIFDGTKPIDVNNAEYALTDSAIIVAHPMDMDEKTVEQWQKYFNSRQLKQPFLQIWEPCRNMADIKEDRYKGAYINRWLLNKKEILGIRINWDGSYYGRFDLSEIKIKGFSVETKVNENETFEIEKIVPLEWNRSTNAVISLLDSITVKGRIHNDDITIAEVLSQFTLAQITEFISIAIKNNCPNVTALLLDFKNKNFADFDPMEEFSLEW